MKILGAEARCSAAGLSLVDVAEEIQARVANRLHNGRLKRAAKSRHPVKRVKETQNVA